MARESFNDWLARVTKNSQNILKSQSSKIKVIEKDTVNKKCAFCNKPFKVVKGTRLDNIKIYCGFSCRMKAARERNIENHKEYKKEWRKFGPRKSRQYCLKCNKKIDFKVGNQYGKFCSEICQNGPKEEVIENCLQCNTPLPEKITKGKTRKYCSETCRTKYFNKKYADKVKTERVSKNCKNCHKPFSARKKQVNCSSQCYIAGQNKLNKTSNKKGDMIKATCNHCKNEFEYKFTTGALRKYCSNECRMNKSSNKIPVEIVSIEEPTIDKSSTQIELISKEDYEVGKEEGLFTKDDDELDRAVKFHFAETHQNYHNRSEREKNYYRQAMLAKHADLTAWKEQTGGTKDRYYLFQELWKKGASAITSHWRIRD